MKDLKNAAGGLLRDNWPATLSVLGLLGLGLCTALYALVSLALPFGWDHGIIASVGSSYVQGGLPYVDSWDMKGPVAYLPFSLAELLFGPTMWGVRLIDLLIWAVAGYVLFDGVRAQTTWRIGVGAALASYLWLASSGWFFTAAPESWVTASCVLAIVPVLAPGKDLKLRTLAMSGFLIAYAGLVKPFYFCFGLAPLVSLALASDVTWTQRFKLAVALAAGAIAGSALVAGYFLLRGGLAQAIEVHLLYPLSSYAAETAGLGVVIPGIASFLLKTPIILTAPFALAALWFWRSRPRILAVLLAWLAVAFFCVAVQGKYFTYHWFPAYPPLFFLGALGAAGFLRTEARPRLVSAIVVACAALVLFSVVARPMRDVVKFAYYYVLSQDPQRYYASYSFRLYNAADEMAAARYVAENTKPGDGVYVWGSNAGVGYLAGRPNPSRFTFAMPLTEPGAYRDIYRAQAVRELEARPPTYFIVGIAWDGLSKGTLSEEDYPAMADFLTRRYQLEKSIGAMDIYRLREAPLVAGAPPAAASPRRPAGRT